MRVINCVLFSHNFLIEVTLKPLLIIFFVAGVGIEPTQAFSVSRLWALHVTVTLPHDI